MMRRRTLAVLAATAAGATGVAAGAVAAAGGGSDERAADLASAINARAGTQLTAEDVKAAFTDVLKQDLAEAVAAGRLTQEQADRMLERAQNGLPPGPPFGRGLHGPRAEILAPVATALGLTEAQLRERLEDGATLAEVAEAEGVSRADLLAAIAAALKDADPSLTDERANAAAARIADGELRMHRGRLGPPARALAPVARALGLTQAEVRTRLRGGDTLAEIAQAEGVSRAALLAAIKRGLKAADPGLSAAQLNDLAGRIADGAGPGRPRGPGGPPPFGP
jgi:DNA-binding CsgD family transcriptional regulator